MSDPIAPVAAPPAAPPPAPSATPAAPLRPSAAANSRSRGHSPAIEQREAAAARASGDAPPAADQQPPPAPDALAPAGDSEVHTFGEMQFTEKELREFLTERGARELRQATLPASPEAYEAKLPENFEMPAGVEFKPDPSDPLLADARRFAHAKGMSQADF